MRCRPADPHTTDLADGRRHHREPGAEASGFLVADRREREGARAAQERPVTDVGAWLQGLGLGQYEAAFRDNGVDASVLPELTAEDLKEIGVAAVGHRRKLLAAIAALRGPL